jgi:lipopolysaccharide transport system ATP-binding protein
MSENMISVKNLSKKYIIAHQQEGRSNYKALRDVIADGVTSLAKTFIKPGGKKMPKPSVLLDAMVQGNPLF